MATHIDSAPSLRVDDGAAWSGDWRDDTATPSSDDEVAAIVLDPAADALLTEIVERSSVASIEDGGVGAQSTRDLGRLTDAELSDRLTRQVLPSLRSRARELGYLSVGHLARAVLDLQGNASHLSHVRALVATLDVPVVSGGALRGARSNPPWVIEAARRLFHDLIQARPDEALVVRRLGYADVPLSPATRAFLVEAWLGHTLSRADEHTLAIVVAAEVERVGADISGWSPEARSARETLILDNLWLCARTARLYVGRGLEVDDLLQAAAEGLFRAVPKFDPDRGVRFVSYAGGWVFQAITRSIGDASRLIRLPVHMHEHERRVEAARDSLRGTLRREPTRAEIAEAAAVSDAVVLAHLVTSRPVSLDAPAHAGRFRNLPSDDGSIEEAAESFDLRRTLADLLGELSERERLVVERRFGLPDGEPETLDTIGQDLGVTRERIRQIEEKALGRLRRPSYARRLADFAPGSTLIESVSQLAAADVIDLLTPDDRSIAAALWGLAGERRQTAHVVAKHRHIALDDMRRVATAVVRLARARAEAEARAAADAPLVGAAPPDRGPFPVADGDVHPGWLAPWPPLAVPADDRRPSGRGDLPPVSAHRPGDAPPTLRPASTPPQPSPPARASGQPRSAPHQSSARRGAPPAPADGTPPLAAAAVARVRPMLLPRSWDVAAALWGLGHEAPQPAQVVAERFGVSPAFVHDVAAAVVRLSTTVPVSQPSPPATPDSPAARAALPPVVAARETVAPPRLVDVLDRSGWARVVAAVAGIDPADSAIVALRTGVDESAILDRRATAHRVRRPETWVYILERVLLRLIGTPSVVAAVEGYWDALDRG